MARPSGPLTRCGGRWTQARFNSFVTSALRQASRRWAPLNDVQKEARVRRGIYLCAHCKEEVPASTRDGRKRVKNVFVDHIKPIVNPETGFTSWDEYVDSIFCEEDNLQVLCKSCHDTKSNEERATSARTRAIRKEEDGK